jgi:hypothetical protein
MFFTDKICCKKQFPERDRFKGLITRNILVYQEHQEKKVLKRFFLSVQNTSLKKQNVICLYGNDLLGKNNPKLGNNLLYNSNMVLLFRYRAYFRA